MTSPTTPSALRFALFTPSGTAFAAGACGSLDYLATLSRRRGIVTVALLRRMEDLPDDWARLLAEQLIGDPALGTLSGYTSPPGPFILVEGGQLDWAAAPTEGIAAAMAAISAADIPTLLRLCAAL